MPRSPLFRLIQRPGLLGALLFVATMALAAALAYQAARAAASHERSVAASLDHHGAIAAWRFARDARIWVGYGMSEAANQLMREIPEAAPLPGPEILTRVLAEKECDCMSAGFSRTVFRVTNDDAPTLTLLGEPLSERAKDSLIVLAVAAAADTTARQGAWRWQILPPGEPRLTRATDIVLLWKIGDRGRGIRAVYGMVVEPAQIERPLRGALSEIEFFPPSLVQSSAPDSLVRIDVAGPNRMPIFEAGPATESYHGTDTLGRSYGNLVVTAWIDPAAARILVGGIPPARAPTIVALFLTALGVGGAALLLLRREHRLVRLREDFVSGVSHELRTPLTQIRVLSELLISDGFHTGEEKTRATRVIHRESLRLTNLVDNVLEFARLRRPPTAAPTTVVSMSEVARELAESLAPLLDANATRVELDIPDAVAIAGDRDAIGRILRNLLENAVKYGPAEQTIRVSARAADLPGGVHVVVDDEGPGIPLEERGRIWQPYYRLERDRNASIGGSGLGLAVVAELARLLGGRAWVTDAPQRGARFVVELPAASADGGAPA